MTKIGDYDWGGDLQRWYGLWWLCDNDDDEIHNDKEDDQDLGTAENSNGLTRLQLWTLCGPWGGWWSIDDGDGEGDDDEDDQDLGFPGLQFWTKQWLVRICHDHDDECLLIMTIVMMKRMIKIEERPKIATAFPRLWVRRGSRICSFPLPGAATKIKIARFNENTKFGGWKCENHKS